MTHNIPGMFMQRALQLAKLGAGTVAPNPMVGAVLVHEGVIIGEGFHQQYGSAHAEVNCIHAALRDHAAQIPASTLYVSLEPCAHYGKTPPCADLIIAHQIPRVVIGCQDPFAKVNGAGIAKLKAAGIEVTEGVLETACRRLNKRFFTFHQYKRPYIILKWAQTANGALTPTLSSGTLSVSKGGEREKERLFITNDYTNRLVHRWRSEEAAIMIGANTAIDDDPLLDNRHWYGKAPVKIVIDPNLRVPPDLKLFQQGAKTIVVNARKNGVQGTVHYMQVSATHFITEMLAALYEHGVQSIFVEGGQQLLQSFIDAGLWDEARVITNTGLFVPGGLPAPVLHHAVHTDNMMMDADRVDYFNHQANGERQATKTGRR